MNEVFTDVLLFASALAVVVLALIQFVKKSINLPANIVPLVGLVVGMLVGVAAYPFTDLDLTLRLWAGGLAGLSATGLYELAFSKRDGSTKDEDLPNKPNYFG